MQNNPWLWYVQLFFQSLHFKSFTCSLLFHSTLMFTKITELTCSNGLNICYSSNKCATVDEDASWLGLCFSLLTNLNSNKFISFLQMGFGGENFTYEFNIVTKFCLVRGAYVPLFFILDHINRLTFSTGIWIWNTWTLFNSTWGRMRNLRVCRQGNLGG